MVLLALLPSSACFSDSQDSCANTVKKEAASPDKILKAVIFERKCGLTSSAQISILPLSNSLADNETGNVFIYKTEYSERETADGKQANVDAKWLDDKQIIVSFEDFATTKVGKMQQQVENVKIIYDKRQVISK